MNLPNKLTVGRIILVPFFVAALLANFPLNNAVALIIFIAASLTDMFDGKIARKNGLVTDFGKFADPLADKILVLAAFLCFVQLGICDCVALPEVGLNFINTATFEPIFFVVGEILIWISVVFTIISGVVYIIQNRQFISQT